MEQGKAPSIEEILQNAKSVFTPGVSFAPPKQEVVIPGQDEPPAAAPAAAPSTAPAVAPAADTPPATEPPVTKPAVIDTPLFKIESAATQGTQTPDDILADFNKKTGLNLAKLEDIATKADEIAKAMQGVKGMDETTRVAFDYKSFFENEAPIELKTAILAFIEGKDYKQVMRDVSNPQIDFSKRFDEYHDVFPLVSRYTSEITKEEFDDMDESAKKAVISAAKRAYGIEFESHVAKGKEFQINHQKKVDALFKSIDHTMEVTKKEFPNLSEKNLKEIRARLELSNYAADFINSDGTYKEDAGVKLGLAMFGKETIETMMQSVSEKNTIASEQEIKKRVAEEIELMTRNRNDVPPGSPSGSQKKDTPVESTMKLNEEMFSKNKGSRFANKELRP